MTGEAKLQLREEGTTWSWGHSWAEPRTKPSEVGGGGGEVLGKMGGKRREAGLCRSATVVRDNPGR